MSYMIDLCFVAVFVLSVILAAKKGFFKTLLDLAAYVLSLIGAKLLSTQLAPAVYAATVQPVLRERIGESISSIAQTEVGDRIRAAVDAIPDALAGLMQMLGISKETLLQKAADVDVSGKHAADRLMQAVVDPVASAVVRTILFVVIAFVLMIVLRLVFLALNRVIKELPAIKQINTGLGVMLGLLRGALLVFLLALALDVIAGFTSSDGFIEAVNHSLIEQVVSGFLKSISGYIAAA